MRRTNLEKFLTFREEVVQLYHQFESDLEELCKKHEVEISFWYKPSAIPQPRFVVNDVEIDADKLYDEEEFSYLTMFSLTRRKTKVADSQNKDNDFPYQKRKAHKILRGISHI